MSSVWSNLVQVTDEQHSGFFAKHPRVCLVLFGCWYALTSLKHSILCKVIKVKLKSSRVRIDENWWRCQDELNRFLGTFFPHPIRFRQIWRRSQRQEAATNVARTWHLNKPRRCKDTTNTLCFGCKICKTNSTSVLQNLVTPQSPWIWIKTMLPWRLRDA